MVRQCFVKTHKTKFYEYIQVARRVERKGRMEVNTPLLNFNMGVYTNIIEIYLCMVIIDIKVWVFWISIVVCFSVSWVTQTLTLSGYFS